MATKTKTRPAPSAPATRSAAAKAVALAPASSAELPRTPPATLEEFAQHIQLLGDRVKEHVEFMCAAGTMPGTSAEARRKAIAQFHARLLSMEHELNRIKEELQLG
jgi:hypothetical protein